MPKILIRNLKNTLLSTNDNSKSLLNIIHENHIDWMHACGAKGRCTTCKMILVEGIENLSPITEAEKKFADLGRLQAHERLACQSKTEGDIVIEVAEANKFPHIEYSA